MQKIARARNSVNSFYSNQAETLQEEQPAEVTMAAAAESPLLPSTSTNLGIQSLGNFHTVAITRGRLMVTDIFTFKGTIALMDDQGP